MARAPADPRAAAARILAAVLGGRSLTEAAPPWLEPLATRRDRALARELAYGACRWQPRLARLLERLLERPPRRKDTDVLALMYLGLYQLRELAVPDHAAVDASAGACRALGKPWAVRLVNGVLRSYLRRAAELEAALERDPVFATAHPQWLLAMLREDWPGRWEQICAAGNRRPPLHLRVNRRRAAAGEYLERLAAAGIAARPHGLVEGAVTLAEPVPAAELPGFAEGLVSVQDCAAQLAAPLLAAEAGQRVLDACAAPGGKTAHIAERCPGLAELVAVDASPDRLRPLRESLARLGLGASVVCGDAAAPEGWWDGEPFDRILLDAPCTATGVIRRHPDIKCLRRAEDAPAMAARQAALLEALWPLLAPGGKLLYATCSVLHRENHARMAAFLERHGDARLAGLDLPFAVDTGAGWQILPGEQGMDGFFYAALARA